MKTLLTSFLLLLTFTASFGQSDLNAEIFHYKFASNKTGGKISYIGKNHYFTIDVLGKVRKSILAESSNGNQHFLTVNNKTVQTSTVPLPNTLPENFKLSSLSIDQQKNLLLGYVNYELEYFKNELNLNLIGLKKEWMLINSKLFILWHFQVAPQNSVDIPTTGQVYLSTVCFNQILVINIPMFKKNDSISDHLPLATQLAKSLKTFNSIKK